MKKLLIICAGVALLAACKKKDDDNKSRTEHLTSGKWHPASSYSYYKITDSATGEVINLTDTTEYATQACELDDYILFNADGTLVFDEGALKCDSSQEQTQNGTWKLLENDTKIFLSNGKASFTTNVKELNGSSFIISDDTSYSDMGYKYESKFETRYKH